MWEHFQFLQQIKKLQLLTQSAALNRETIAASQLATSTGSSSSGSGSQATSSATAADSSTTLTAQGSGGSRASSSRGDGNGDAGSAAGKLLANRGAGASGDGGAASILTVDEDTLSLDRLNSLRIYMTSVKTLPFNLRIYG